MDVIMEVPEAMPHLPEAVPHLPEPVPDAPEATPTLVHPDALVLSPALTRHIIIDRIKGKQHFSLLSGTLF
jgi:hypothetical protein